MICFFVSSCIFKNPFTDIKQASSKTTEGSESVSLVSAEISEEINEILEGNKDKDIVGFFDQYFSKTSDVFFVKNNKGDLSLTSSGSLGLRLSSAHNSAVFSDIATSSSSNSKEFQSNEGVKKNINSLLVDNNLSKINNLKYKKYFDFIDVGALLSNFSYTNLSGQNNGSENSFEIDQVNLFSNYKTGSSSDKHAIKHQVKKFSLKYTDDNVFLLEGSYFKVLINNNTAANDAEANLDVWEELANSLLNSKPKYKKYKIAESNINHYFFYPEYKLQALLSVLFDYCKSKSLRILAMEIKMQKPESIDGFDFFDDLDNLNLFFTCQNIANSKCYYNNANISLDSIPLFYFAVDF